MHSSIQPNSHIILRLPSLTLKIVQIIPNTVISIGKFGSFPANLLLERPYHLTFEILEKDEGRAHTDLRVVSASELHAEAILGDGDTPPESRDEVNPELVDDIEYDVQANGTVTLRSNRNIVDDSSRQALTYEEIEELKKLQSGNQMVEALMQSHSGLDEKTAFSLAKYVVRKREKYLKRFTVLPLDVSSLLEFIMTEKDAPRIMELREEVLGLITCWSNVHYMEPWCDPNNPDNVSAAGRWLVVDETGGLIVAALAEKLGILYSTQEDQEDDGNGEDHMSDAPSININEDAQLDVEQQIDQSMEQKTSNLQFRVIPSDTETNERQPDSPESHTPKNRPRRRPIHAQSATSNSITLVHAAPQPNLALLKYFDFEETMTNTKHPFYTHLKTLSWLQLLSPEDDAAYHAPETFDEETVKSWKGGKRSNYFRKQRRWKRVKAVIDNTRQGDFDGLIIASVMEPAGLLQHLLPLLKGGASVVVYNPSIEPLAELADLFSRPRRTAFMANPPEESEMPTDDFPIDPTLLLNSTVQTCRARSWQVLPGRTHPVMMARGGAEGYVFSGIRVLKSDSGIKARGRFSKRRKVEQPDGIDSPRT